MRKLLTFVLLSICIPALVYTDAYSAQTRWRHPGVKILATYNMPVGKKTTVNPYIVSLLSIHAVRHERIIDDVRNFINWYFTHLNYPDKYGLTGTIYDYSVSEKSEMHDRDYDSIDGYAGIFLVLLEAYYNKTGDTVLIKKNWQKIKDIAYLISMLQDRDGLTKVTPDNSTKYLMNNCEAFGGIAAFNRLSVMMGAEDKYYRNVERSLKEAIIRLFSDTSEHNFYWAIAGNTLHKSSWKTPYPDAFAQLFPILHGLIEKDAVSTRQIWGRFIEIYGKKLRSFSVEQQIVIQMTKDIL